MLGFLGMIMAMFFALGPTGGVTVHLKNGKSVHGELLQETPKFVLLEIDLGQLLVQRKNIERLVEDPGEEVSGDPPRDSSGASSKEGRGATRARSPAPTPGGSNRIPSHQVPPAPGGIAPSTSGPRESRKKPSAPAHRSKSETSPTNLDPLEDWTLPLHQGRLLDRYTWFYDLEISTKISVGAGLLFLLWIGFLLGGRILGVDTISKQRALAAAGFWFVLLVGVLLVPNPSLLIMGVVLFLILVAWFISSRGVLRLGWFHSFVLLVLGGFGLSLVALVVEVSESLINL